MAKQEYFLGAIVTTRAGEGPSASFHVIDGQQRLTTLFIMLACLREWAQQQVWCRGWNVRLRPPACGCHGPICPLLECTAQRHRLYGCSTATFPF